MAFVAAKIANFLPRTVKTPVPPPLESAHAIAAVIAEAERAREEKGSA